eukprot:scaffold4091_cov92-Cylindrotheca_fusiformis.AAC.1
MDETHLPKRFLGMIVESKPIVAQRRNVATLNTPRPCPTFFQLAMKNDICQPYCTLHQHNRTYPRFLPSKFNG